MKESQKDPFKLASEEKSKTTKTEGEEEEKFNPLLNLQKNTMSVDIKTASVAENVDTLTKQEGNNKMPILLAQGNLPEKGLQEDHKISLTAQSCSLDNLEESVKPLEKDIIKTYHGLPIAELIFPIILAKSLEEIIIESQIESKTILYSSCPSMKSLLLEDILSEKTKTLVKEIHFNSKLSLIIREKIVGKYIGSKTLAIAKIGIHSAKIANTAFDQILEKSITTLASICRKESELGLNNSVLEEELNKLVADDLLGVIRELLRKNAIKSIGHIKIITLLERVFERNVISKEIERLIANHQYLIGVSEITCNTIFSEKINSELSTQVLSTHTHFSLINSIWQDIIEKEINLQGRHYLVIGNEVEELINKQFIEIAATEYKREIKCFTANEEYNDIIGNVIGTIIDEEFNFKKKISQGITENMMQIGSINYIEECFNSISQDFKYSRTTIENCSEELTQSAIAKISASSYELGYLTFGSTNSLNNLFIEQFTLELCENLFYKINIQSTLTNDLVNEIDNSELLLLAKDCILSQILENLLIDTETTILTNSIQDMNKATLFCSEELIVSAIKELCSVSYNSSLIAYKYSEENVTLFSEQQICTITQNIHSSFIASTQILQEVLDELTLAGTKEISNSAILSNTLLADYLEIQINYICQSLIDRSSIIVQCFEDYVVQNTTKFCENSLTLFRASYEYSRDIDNLISERQAGIIAKNALNNADSIMAITNQISQKCAILNESEIIKSCLAVKEILKKWIETEIAEYCRSNIKIARLALHCSEPLTNRISREITLNSYLVLNIAKKISDKIMNRFIEEQVGITVINSAIKSYIALPIAEDLYIETKRRNLEILSMESIISSELDADFMQDMAISCCKTKLELEKILNMLSEEFINSANAEMCADAYYTQLVLKDLSIDLEKSYIENNAMTICNNSFDTVAIIGQENDCIIADECEKAIQNSFYNYTCASQFFESFLLNTIVVEDLYLWVNECGVKSGVSQEVYDTLERDFIISACEKVFTEQPINISIQKEIANQSIEKQIMESVNTCFNDSIVSANIAENYINDYLLVVQTEAFISGNENNLFYSYILEGLILSEIQDCLIPTNICKDLINSSISLKELDTFPSTNNIQSFTSKITQNTLFEFRITEIEFYKMLDRITYENMCKPCMKRAYTFRKNSTLMSRSFYSILIQKETKEIITTVRLIKDISADILNLVPISLTKSICAYSYNSTFANKDILFSLGNSIMDEILKQELNYVVNYACETLQLVESYYEPYLLTMQSMVCENVANNYLIIPRILSDFVKEEINSFSKEVYEKIQLTIYVTSLIARQLCKRKVMGVIEAIYIQEQNDNKCKNIIYKKSEEHLETSLIPEVCGIAIWEHKFCQQYVNMLTENEAILIVNNTMINHLTELTAMDLMMENALQECCKERFEKGKVARDVAIEINEMFIERMIRIQAKLTVDAKKHSSILGKGIRDKYYSNFLTEQSKALRETKYRDCIAISAVYSGLINEIILETYNSVCNWNRKNDINNMVAKEVYSTTVENMVENIIVEPLISKAKIATSLTTKLLYRNILRSLLEIEYKHVSAIFITESIISNKKLIQKLYQEIKQDIGVSKLVSQKMLSKEGYLCKLVEEINCRNIIASTI